APHKDAVIVVTAAERGLAAGAAGAADRNATAGTAADHGASLHQDAVLASAGAVATTAVERDVARGAADGGAVPIHSGKVTAGRRGLLVGQQRHVAGNRRDAGAGVQTDGAVGAGAEVVVAEAGVGVEEDPGRGAVQRDVELGRVGVGAAVVEGDPGAAAGVRE